MKTTIQAAHHVLEIDMPELTGPTANRAEASRLRAIRGVLDRLAANAMTGVVANALAQVQCLATHGDGGEGDRDVHGREGRARLERVSGTRSAMRDDMNNATKTETTRTVAFTGTAFGGARERLSVALDADGGVRVFDEIAGHYTRAHALSEQDIAAARLAPCEHYWSCGCGCTRDSGPIR